MFNVRLFIIAAVLVGLAAATDYGCQVATHGFQKGTCNIAANAPVQCRPRQPTHGSGKFQPADFVHMCLGDGGKTCAEAANTAALIKPDGSNSCCSCYLYARYCHGRAANSIVTNDKTLSGSVQDHVLVMPANPCTGVEVWGKHQCPDETIWTIAHSYLPPSTESDYGMAINPIIRRGQHQMHIHLAKAEGSVKSALAAGFKAHNGNDFCLNCGSGSKLDQCTKTVAAGSCTSNMPRVTIKTGKTAGDAAPFATVYGSNQNAMLNNAAFVMRLPLHVKPDTWAVVSYANGPAECFFPGTSNHC